MNEGYRDPAPPDVHREPLLVRVMPLLRAAWIVAKVFLATAIGLYLLGYVFGRMDSCSAESNAAFHLNEYRFCRSTCEMLGGQNFPRHVRIQNREGPDQCRCGGFGVGRILTFPVGASEADEFVWISVPTPAKRPDPQPTRSHP